MMVLVLLSLVLAGVDQLDRSPLPHYVTPCLLNVNGAACDVRKVSDYDR